MRTLVRGLVLLAAVATVGSCTLTSTPTASNTPTPTPKATRKSSEAPKRTPAPHIVSSTAEHVAGGVTGLAVRDGTIWALEASSAGHPGWLLRGTSKDPRFHRFAKVGTYAGGLAVTADREWVVNGTGSPRDKAFRSGTVDEYDTKGQVLHEYLVPNAVSVVAKGHRAWVMVLEPGTGVTRIDVLTNGTATKLTQLTPNAIANNGNNTLALRTDGRLVAITMTAKAPHVWVLDAKSGRYISSTAIAINGTPSLAIVGDSAYVSAAATDGGVVFVQGSTARTLPNCGRYTQGVAASTGLAWTLDELHDRVDGVARVSSAGCGDYLQVPDVDGSRAMVASGHDLWVLTTIRLYLIR
jgi:hypothetical protein